MYSCPRLDSFGFTFLLLLTFILRGSFAPDPGQKDEDFYPEGVIKRVLQKARTEMGIPDPSCENIPDVTIEHTYEFDVNEKAREFLEGIHESDSDPEDDEEDEDYYDDYDDEYDDDYYADEYSFDDES